MFTFPTSLSRNPAFSLIDKATPMTWINTSSGQRQSIFDNIGDRAANGLDLYVSPQGIPWYGSVDGYTNSASSNIADYSKIGANVTISGDDTITFTNGDLSNKVYYAATSLGGTVWTATFEVELVSGDPTDFRCGISDGAAGVNNVDLSDMSIGERRKINVTGTIAGTEPRLTALEYRGADGTGTSTFKVYNMRLVEKTAAYPALLDATGVGTTVAEDIIVSSNSISSVSTGTIVAAWMDYYDWNQTQSWDDNPVADTVRLYQIGPLTVRGGTGLYLRQAATVDSFNNGSSLSYYNGRHFYFSMFTWTGTTNILYTPQEVTSIATTETFSGPVELGNRSTNGRALHGAVSFLYLDGYVATPRDYNYFINLYERESLGITFK